MRLDLNRSGHDMDDRFVVYTKYGKIQKTATRFSAALQHQKSRMVFGKKSNIALDVAAEISLKSVRKPTLFDDKCINFDK
ncbi:hypothetical protein QU487_10595 [Crenobacter sp. SG2305]|uniref:hypothetical protein n=1 Tax=Crenobacter oryzisoli TaxID=3056844 RepID=UPI0025AA67AA|nr:hypothetical protein [Crenobacter sp. SG2305]MDN0083199.1 hypothetical protein [Crenobacter sp. SG2305]